jgi:3-deoxy-manno-octulosonate cytidylyltransferase (CMP-KDO synthetase)
MYTYRKDVPEKITPLPVSGLERAESLKQLHWLENGFTIKCILTAYESHCIDTPPEDLERAIQLMHRSS